MAKKPSAPARKKVERIIDVDVSRLFDVTLSEAASYLFEIQTANPGREIYLVERWLGYEDSEFRFVYDELENDEEYEARMEQERRQQEKEQADLKRKAEIKAIDREIELLNRKRRGLSVRS